MNDNTIGENIRKYRKRGNYTQKQFAQALGISAATLSSYEVGKTIPDISLICKIALMFNTTTDEIVGLYEPDESEETELSSETEE